MWRRSGPARRRSRHPLRISALPRPGGGTADSELSNRSALTGLRVRIPTRAYLERHLRAALAAGAGALRHRLVGGGEGLAEPAAELARRLGRAAATEADRPFRAVLRLAREAREQEGQDQQQDA